MNWQTADDTPREEKKISFRFKNQDDTTDTTMIDELEEKKSIQLQKFKDPATNPERQSYLNLTSQFSDLLLNNKLDEMISTILTDDCEFFIFSSTDRAPVQYSLTPQDIHSLYKGVKIYNRLVAESYVDLEKKTAVQFCHYIIHYEDEDSPVNEIVAEIFTIREHQISRYRATFSRSTTTHGGKDPFELSRKDRILMKLKEINYAIAGQPDLEKVASFFTEDTQYKIWSWESPKCAIFNKHNFAEGFRKLQENFEIKCCVPYDISIDTEHIFGTYVYHLEGKTGKFKDQKFVWLTTCVYTFNENLNLVRVSQQGELHTEGDVLIPFEVYSKEKIAGIMKAVTGEKRVSVDLFYNDIVQFACPLYRYAAKGLPNVGFLEGLNHFDKIQKIQQKRKGNTNANIEWRTIDDIFIDSNGSGYDVGIIITCTQGTFNFQDYKYNGLKINNFNIARASFEKGKVVKGLMASFGIPEPIPSPFDNPNIEGVTIVPRNKWSEGSKSVSKV